MQPDGYPLERYWPKANSGAQLSDLLRLDVLYKWGGVYLDGDMRLLKPLDELAERFDFFIASHDGMVPINALIGATKGASGNSGIDRRAPVERTGLERAPGQNDRTGYLRAHFEVGQTRNSVAARDVLQLWPDRNAFQEKSPPFLRGALVGIFVEGPRLPPPRRRRAAGDQPPSARSSRRSSAAFGCGIGSSRSTHRHPKNRYSRASGDFIPFPTRSC